MDETRRLAVTLTNGRSHTVDLPEEVPAEQAAEVLRGARAGSEVGWPDGDADWLSFGSGQGWVRRDAIAELAVVEFFADEYATQVYD